MKIWILVCLLAVVQLLLCSGCGGNICRAEEPGGLFAEAMSKNIANAKAAPLLNKIMSNFPHAAYSITIGKPEVLSSDIESNQANVSVPTTVQWNKNFLDELKAGLQQIAKSKFRYGDFDKYYNETTKAIPGVNGQSYIGICLVTKASALKNILDDCYMLDIYQIYNIKRENWAFNHYRSESKISYGIIKRQNDLKFMYIFMSKDNKELFTIPYAYFESLNGETDNCVKQKLVGVDNTMCYNNAYRSLPNLFPSFQDMSENSLILADGVFKFNANMTVGLDILKQTKAIIVSIEPWTE